MLKHPQPYLCKVPVNIVLVSLGWVLLTTDKSELEYSYTLTLNSINSSVTIVFVYRYILAVFGGTTPTLCTLPLHIYLLLKKFRSYYWENLESKRFLTKLWVLNKGEYQMKIFKINGTRWIQDWLKVHLGQFYQHFLRIANVKHLT